MLYILSNGDPQPFHSRAEKRDRVGGKKNWLGNVYRQTHKPMTPQSQTALRLPDDPAIPAWLLALAILSMTASQYLTFSWVSTEATMGIIQRIFYLHVPAAMVAFCAVFAGGVASLRYLATADPRYDDFAAAANESVLVFSVINISLGSLWGRRVWGIWWTWDARLTTSLLLVLIYCAYFLLRKAAPIEQRAVTSAVVCLFGMVDVPLIYLSNRLFRTQHPAPVLAGGADSGLERDMLITFIVCNVSMFLFWCCLVRVRQRIQRLERTVAALNLVEYEEIYVR